MRARIIAFVLLLIAGLSAYAQEARHCSIELGAGIGPVHMYFPGACPSSIEKSMLSEKGQSIYNIDAPYPELSLSFVWETKKRWDLAVTAGVSTCRYQIAQHDQFGTDPQGKPRFKYQNPTPGEYRLAAPLVSLTFQGRYNWISSSGWKLYSGLTVGLVAQTDNIKEGAFPFPGIIPVGASYGKGHLYCFAEMAINSVAALGQAGLGWRF